jgi:hypothetical protein
MVENVPIPIEMTVAEWNQVLAALAEGPFRVVAPLIGKIREQATAAVARLSPPEGAAAQPAPEKADGLSH